MTAPFDVPAVLKYDVSLPLSGQVVSPSVDIKNSYKQPMWVDEFRVVITDNDVLPPGSINANQVLTSIISVRFRLNGKLLFDDFVPLAMLSPILDPVTYYGISCLVRFDKPLWLDPDDEFYAEFRFNDLPAPLEVGSLVAGLNLYMLLSCVTLGRLTDMSKRPAERHLPFAVSWTQENPFLPTEPDFAHRVSPDTALFNGRGKPVCVTSIQGTKLNNYDAPSFNSEQLRIQISDSQGGYIVKDSTPIHELFGIWVGRWDVSFVMKPKEYWTVEVQFREPSTIIGGQEGVIVQMGMKGYQTEELRPR